MKVSLCMVSFMRMRWKLFDLEREHHLVWQKCAQFKGSNSGYLGQLSRLSNFGKTNLPLSIVTKFHEDLIKAVWLRERTYMAAIPPVSQPACRWCLHNTSHFQGRIKRIEKDRSIQNQSSYGTLSPQLWK